MFTHFLIATARPSIGMLSNLELGEVRYLRIEAGQMLIFNNHRLLHGRTAFDFTAGRHVRVVRVGFDEFHLYDDLQTQEKKVEGRRV